MTTPTTAELLGELDCDCDRAQHDQIAARVRDDLSVLGVDLADPPQRHAVVALLYMLSSDCGSAAARNHTQRRQSGSVEAYVASLFDYILQDVETTAQALDVASQFAYTSHGLELACRFREET